LEYIKNGGFNNLKTYKLVLMILWFWNFKYSYKIRFPEKKILIKDNISNYIKFIKKNNLLDFYTLLNLFFSENIV